jgi:hypothetical protein
MAQKSLTGVGLAIPVESADAVEAPLMVFEPVNGHIWDPVGSDAETETESIRTSINVRVAAADHCTVAPARDESSAHDEEPASDDGALDGAALRVVNGRPVKYADAPKELVQRTRST